MALPPGSRSILGAPNPNIEYPNPPKSLCSRHSTPSATAFGRELGPNGARLGQDPDRVFALAKTVKAQFPDDPNIADTLGLAYMAKGAVRLYHLGLVHWKKGDKQEAFKPLYKALNLKTAFVEQQDPEELLREINLSVHGFSKHKTFLNIVGNLYDFPLTPPLQS